MNNFSNLRVMDGRHLEEIRPLLIMAATFFAATAGHENSENVSSIMVAVLHAKTRNGWHSQANPTRIQCRTQLRAGQDIIATGATQGQVRWKSLVR